MVIMLFLKGSLSEMVNIYGRSNVMPIKGVYLLVSCFFLLLCLKCQDQQTPISEGVAELSGLGSQGWVLCAPCNSMPLAQLP